jgi:signal transduction histidine kinase/DNA-binding response OmpR family regulator
MHLPYLRLSISDAAPHLPPEQRANGSSAYPLSAPSPTDVTPGQVAQVRAQEAALQRQAAQNRAQARFFANLAHEFRTSLTLLIGPLQELLSGSQAVPDEPEAYTALRRQHSEMLQHAQGLMRLVGQLLDLSKLEGGRMPLCTRRDDLIPFLKGIVQAFAPLAERKGVALHVVCDVNTLPVDFDPDQIEKVFYNLLGNALKFTGGGGKVGLYVQSRSTEEAVEVRVCDTGPGIPEKDQPFIFDRFYRVEETARSYRMGTGIGLALAKELVELHSGTIRLESTPGMGSAFVVTLPQRQTAGGSVPTGRCEGHTAEPYRAAVAGAPPAPFRRPTAVPDAPRVLIVDDNPEVRAYLRDLLTPAYRVEEAGDGKTGLEQARRQKPALILCDVRMPVMDGCALLARLKNDPATRPIPVLMLTAGAETATQIKSWEAGADGFLLKPFDPQVLRARIGQMIRTRRQLRAQYSREVVLRPTGVVIQPEDAAFLERARTVAEARLGDECFDVQAMAEALGLSRRHLQRSLRRVTGMSPCVFLRTLRLERARQWLEQGPVRIAEVAYAVGFRSVSHFSQCFHAQYGQTPSAFAGSH